MHIVEIRGGLGNQMFCYAFGQNFADVLYDKSEYGVSEKRPLDLELYNIKAVYATKEQTAPYITRSKFPRFIRKWFNIPTYKNITREKQSTLYEPELLQVKDSYFKGYFQNENYFKHMRPKILHDLTLKKPLDEANAKLLDEIKQTNSVSIHVRRGDYFAAGFPILGMEYYQKAIDYIAERVENPHFYVFSNDFDWVRENIKTGYAQTIVDINDESHGYYDLELMRNCKHNIIANSTFSWWGAWLNENPDKIVVSSQGDNIPSEWFMIK